MTRRTVARTLRTANILLVGIIVVDVLALFLFLPTNIGASIVGYLLAPFVATGLVGYYQFTMIEASQNLGYRPSSKQRRNGKLVIGALVGAFLIGLGHSWIVATEIAKAFSS